MTEVVVLGVGTHPFGRFDTGYEDLGTYAARAALKDAGLDWAQMEFAYFARMYLPATSGARVLKKLGRTGIPIADTEAACASGGVALRQAMLAIKSGEASVGMVLGVEKMPRGFMDPSMIYSPWQIETGLSMNPAYWAMRARRHMHDFGTTEEQIAQVAYKNHKNSVHNPDAMYQRAFSIEEILSSPLICDPVRLLEVCSPNDGAAAVIVASADKARQLGINGKPITVSACSHTIARYSSDFRCPEEAMSATISNASPSEDAARLSYETAGMGPDDIDCFEVQDTDAFCEIEAIEYLGLCAEGEGGRMAAEGTTHIGGQKPVNMSGGLISKGEPVGASHLGQIVELVRQLRGQAGKRQVVDARVALGHVLGAGGNCAVTILKS